MWQGILVRETIIIIINNNNFKVGHQSLFRVRILTSEIYESIRTIGKTPWAGLSPTQCLYLHRITQHRKTQTHPCLKRDLKPRSHFRAVKDSRCLRPRGHWDRLMYWFIGWLILIDIHIIFEVFHGVKTQITTSILKTLFQIYIYITSNGIGA